MTYERRVSCDHGFMSYAAFLCPYQFAHPRSLINIYAVGLNIALTDNDQSTDMASVAPYQAGRILVWSYIVLEGNNDHFRSTCRRSMTQNEHRVLSIPVVQARAVFVCVAF